MAKIEIVGSFMTILLLMLFLITSSGAMYVSGISADFGMDASTDIGKAAGMTDAINDLETVETEPNMLQALSANIKMFQTVREVFAAVTNFTTVLVNLPLIPAWVSFVSVTLTLVGSIFTGWYLITNKKV
jgi:hypothetical protein|tara:strand:- start:1948 stop:2337 length:390 start_codon:yes stop_codon:yes gene_type:complete